MSSWNDADLEARLCRALDIARKTIDLFGLDGYIDDVTPIYSFGPEKPLAETAMLMYACAGCHDRPAVRARIDALAASLIPLARSERVLFNMAAVTIAVWVAAQVFFAIEGNRPQLDGPASQKLKLPAGLLESILRGTFNHSASAIS